VPWQHRNSEYHLLLEVSVGEKYHSTQKASSDSQIPENLDDKISKGLVSLQVAIGEDSSLVSHMRNNEQFDTFPHIPLSILHGGKLSRP
jgi:hypothetical protein